MFPWLASLSMRAFGETSEWALRLPSAVLGVGLVLVVRALGARLLGARLGFVAALAFAGTFLVVNLARRARVDMTLSFFVCLALLQFVAMFQEDEAAPDRPPATWRNVVLWLSLTFATLTKGPLGVILMCLWHAEEADQAIAEKLIDVAAEALHGSGGALLVLLRDAVPILRVESRGDFGRANQVAEQHRQLATFAFGAGFRVRGSGFKAAGTLCPEP